VSVVPHVSLDGVVIVLDRRGLLVGRMAVVMPVGLDVVVVARRRLLVGRVAVVMAMRLDVVLVVLDLVLHGLAPP